MESPERVNIGSNPIREMSLELTKVLSFLHERTKCDINGEVGGITIENRRIFGLEFDPLDINRAKAVEKMLLGFFFVSLTLGFMACRAFDN